MVGVMRSKLPMIYKATKRSLCVSVCLSRSACSPSRAPLHVNISHLCLSVSLSLSLSVSLSPSLSFSVCVFTTSELSCSWLHQLSHELYICTLTAPNQQENPCLINKKCYESLSNIPECIFKRYFLYNIKLFWKYIFKTVITFHRDLAGNYW